MILDNIEVKEDFDRTVTPDSRVSRNQIRTKMSTFQAIKKYWTNFRLSRLNKKLEDKKNNLVTTAFGSGSSGVSDRAVKAIERKTTAIARLEEKIKILSKEEVPALYVKHRAIKLKEKMMANLSYNCSSGYSVGMANYDKIFGPEVAQPQVNDFAIPQASASLAASDSSIDVEKISTNNQQSIASEVNKAMTPETPLDRDTIQNVLNDSLANINNPVVTPVAATPAVSAQPVQTPAAVAPVIAPAAEIPVASVSPTVAPIDRGTIEETIDDSLANLSIPEVTSVVEGPAEVTPQAESPIDRDTIQSVLNQSMNEIPPVQGAVTETPVVSPTIETPAVAPVTMTPVVTPVAETPVVSAQPVETPVTPAVTPTVTPVAEIPSVTPVVDNPVETADVTKNVVEVSPEEVQKIVSTPVVSPIDYSGLSKAVAAAVDGVTVKNVEPVNDFAEEMRLRKEKYNYVPMTDEEIAASREKLEMDKYDQIYSNQWAAIKNNSVVAPSTSDWATIRGHFADFNIVPQWNAIGDYYRQIGLGEAWDVVRNRVTNSSVNSRWDSKEHNKENQAEEVLEHYFGAVPVEWDVVRRRFQDEEIMNHFDEIREHFIGVGLGEQWDTFFGNVMSLNQEQLHEEVDNSVQNDEVGTPVSSNEVVPDTEQKEETPVREPIVVVPERTEIDTKEIVNEDQSEEVIADEPVVTENENQDLHFDYSHATKKDVVIASDYENSRLGLDALKARVKELQKELKQSEEDLKDARDEQTDVAREAMEVREANRAQQRLFAGRLQDFCNKLEERAKINRSSAAISRNDTECNRRFIESQTAEMRDYENQIREIDSFLSGDEEETKKKAM